LIAGTACGVAVLVAVGCNGVKPGRAPRDTFEAAKRAILEENYAGLWRLVSARSRDAAASKIRAQQRQVIEQLGNMTPKDKEAFLRVNGISPDEFANLSPAEAFALQIRNNTLVIAGLRQALLDSSVDGEDIEGETATVGVRIPGEATAKVSFVREGGLWFIPSTSDFFASLRLTGRMLSAGKTPRETYEAMLACIAQKKFGKIWDLYGPECQAALATQFQQAIDMVKRLDEDGKREFRRQAGMDADQYVKLGPEELLELELKLKFRNPADLEAAQASRIVDTTIRGDTAVLTVWGVDGSTKVTLKKQGERWYFSRSPHLPTPSRGARQGR
jgi:hypothetical protein